MPVAVIYYALLAGKLGAKYETITEVEEHAADTYVA